MSARTRKIMACKMRLYAEKSLNECGDLSLSELAYETSKRCKFQIGHAQLANILRGHDRIQKRNGYHRNHWVCRSVYFVE